MKLIILLLGILLILSGVSLLFAPEIIFEFLEKNKENLSLYISAIVVRLVLGILLIKSANESKYPVIIKILGFLFIIIAVIFIFIGRESFQDLISSLLPVFKPYGRIGGLASMAFGSFLIYAFSAQKN